jgi:HPt (histidine-containing phosphotransfer) domain-containing protein
MDDYLSKPIRAEDVYRVLLCHLSQAAVRKPQHAVAFNPDQLLDVSERDETMIETLVAQYFTDAPGYFSDFRDAVHSGDRVQIHETAHRLKGLIVLTGGEKLGALLHRIENSVIGKDCEIDNRMLADVETEKLAFETALKKVDWKTLCESE